MAPGGRTVVGVATCGGASGRQAYGSVAWRLERWRERERERKRQHKKRKTREGGRFFGRIRTQFASYLHREKISALDSVGEDPNR